MKTLILVRHTKSSWKDASLADIDRPIKKSRADDAMKVAAQIRSLQFKPDLIISSSAKRALETATIFAKALSYATDKIKIEPRIYETGSKDLLETITAIDPKFQCVMIFGHNPCFENFLAEYTDSKIESLPTTGAVWLELENDTWHINKKKRASQRHYLYPKMLKLFDEIDL